MNKLYTWMNTKQTELFQLNYTGSRHVTKRVLHEEYFNYMDYFNNRIQQYLWVLVFSFALNWSGFLCSDFLCSGFLCSGFQCSGFLCSGFLCLGLLCLGLLCLDLLCLDLLCLGLLCLGFLWLVDVDFVAVHKEQQHFFSCRKIPVLPLNLG